MEYYLNDSAAKRVTSHEVRAHFTKYE